MERPREERCIYCGKPITIEQDRKYGGYCSKEHHQQHFDEVMEESEVDYE